MITATIDGRKNTSGKCHVIILVRFGDKRKVIPTKVYIEPECWSKKKRRVINHPNETAYNLIIKEQINALELEESLSRINGKEFTPESLKKKPSDTFNAFYERELNSDKGITPGTLKDQKKTLNAINECIEIGVSSLDVTFVRTFDNYLRSKKLATSTIFNHHKNIKKYIHRAIEQGLLEKSPYVKFKMSRPKSNRPFLTFNEIESIYNKEYSFPRLKKAADLFVFQATTGLRDSDLKRVKKEMYDGDNLNLVPLKTSRSSQIRVMLPISKLFKGLPLEILEKYDWQLPSFTNQEYNRLLKSVANECGIFKNITTHIARHSFLTNVAVKTGNVFIVMQLGGLAKIETAQIYIHLASQFSSKELNDLW